LYKWEWLNLIWLCNIGGDCWGNFEPNKKKNTFFQRNNFRILKRKKNFEKNCEKKKKKPLNISNNSTNRTHYKYYTNQSLLLSFLYPYHSHSSLLVTTSPFFFISLPFFKFCGEKIRTDIAPITMASISLIDDYDSTDDEQDITPIAIAPRGQISKQPEDPYTKFNDIMLVCLNSF